MSTLWPLIEDIVFKLARKALSPDIYRRLSYGGLGRGEQCHRPQIFADIHRHYLERGLDFAGKTVLEVGPGRQLFTAFHFLADGAREVLVADPVADASSLAEQAEAFRAREG